MLSGTFHGSDRETGLLEETGRCPEKRDQKLQSNSADIGDVKVVCILFYSALGQGQGACKMEKLHFEGIDGITCQHLQVLVTNLHQKHWEWKEERNPLMKRGAVVRPTNVRGKLGYQDGLR